MIPAEPANDMFGPPREHHTLRPSGVERSSEERSEDDGMPEHPEKAADPVGWARSVRAAPPAPETGEPAPAGRPVSPEHE